MPGELSQSMAVAETTRMAELVPPAEEHLVAATELSKGFRVHLVDYWQVLVRRRWVVFTTMATVLTVVAISTWKQTPIYRATLKLQIDSEASSLFPIRNSGPAVMSYVPTDEQVRTEIESLSSQTLATRVIRLLKLDKDPRFVARSSQSERSKLMEWLRSHVPLPRRRQPAAQPARQATKKSETFSPYSSSFVSALTVTPVRDSRIVRISFDARDPQLAADVLNSLAAEYIQMNFETKYNAISTASDFLSKQLVELKANVEESEEEMVKFGQQHDIVTLSEKENVIFQKLVELNSALTTAQAERIQKQSVWDIVRQHPSDRFPDILRTPQIRELEGKVAELQQQHARLRTVFKPGWPELKQVTGQLGEAEKQLAQEREQSVRNAEAEYRAALQREKLLVSALEAQKQEANTLSRNSIEYNILKREVESSKQLYDGLLQRIKEASVSAGLKSDNIHVVDPAEPPAAPFKPDKVMNMTFGFAFALVLGVALAFFLEYLHAYFDRSLRTPEEVDRFVRLPFLGLVPSLYSSMTRRQRRLLHSAFGNQQQPARAGVAGPLPAPSPVALISHQNARSSLAEAYRSLRTSVLLASSGDHPPKTLLVTSSQKGEGKTTTAINLAITLAQTGKRVLLADGDMRNPNIHRHLNIDNAEGLSILLAGSWDRSSPLVHPTMIPNMYAFTAGPIPPNPAELIGSLRMKKCLAGLERNFDHIVVDSSPLLCVADARILATLVDGVILVIKGGVTPKEAVDRSKRLLQGVRARILGTVLNNVDLRAVDSYYGSKYYYQENDTSPPSSDGSLGESRSVA